MTLDEEGDHEAQEDQEDEDAVDRAVRGNNEEAARTTGGGRGPSPTRGPSNDGQRPPQRKIRRGVVESKHVLRPAGGLCPNCGLIRSSQWSTIEGVAEVCNSCRSAYKSAGKECLQRRRNKHLPGGPPSPFAASPASAPSTVAPAAFVPPRPINRPPSFESTYEPEPTFAREDFGKRRPKPRDYLPSDPHYVLPLASSRHSCSTSPASSKGTSDSVRLPGSGPPRQHQPQQHSPSESDSLPLAKRPRLDLHPNDALSSFSSDVPSSLAGPPTRSPARMTGTTPARPRARPAFAIDQRLPASHLQSRDSSTISDDVTAAPLPPAPRRTTAPDPPSSFPAQDSHPSLPSQRPHFSPAFRQLPSSLGLSSASRPAAPLPARPSHAPSISTLAAPSQARASFTTPSTISSLSPFSSCTFCGASSSSLPDTLPDPLTAFLPLPLPACCSLSLTSPSSSSLSAWSHLGPAPPMHGSSAACSGCRIWFALRLFALAGGGLTPSSTSEAVETGGCELERMRAGVSGEVAEMALRELREMGVRVWEGQRLKGGRWWWQDGG